jgi:hypothetical protein
VVSTSHNLIKKWFYKLILEYKRTYLHIPLTLYPGRGSRVGEVSQIFLWVAHVLHIIQVQWKCCNYFIWYRHSLSVTFIYFVYLMCFYYFVTVWHHQGLPSVCSIPHKYYFGKIWISQKRAWDAWATPSGVCWIYCKDINWYIFFKYLRDNYKKINGIPKYHKYQSCV